jgi:hypothetical protein
MTREKIKLTVSELNDCRCGDSTEYDLIKSEITGTFRHGNDNEAIIKRVSDGRLFKINYRDLVKDECEFQDMNYDEEYQEVFPVEKTIIVYE